MEGRPRAAAAAAAAGLAGLAGYLWYSRRSKASDRARRLATTGLQHPAARRPTLHGTGRDLSRPQVEEGVEVGSHVICRLKTGWVNNAYVYGRVTRLDPIEVLGCEGRTLPVENLAWVMLSQDDGWLAPYDLGWQKPGRYVLMQLLTREWVSARISSWHKAQPIRTGRLMLQLEGVPSLEEVCIEDDVALLLVPHDDCQEEFGHAQPQRGGWLSDHINAAFELDTPSQGETQAEAEHKQRLRWVETSRTDGQYPIRSVWVHPSIKGGALNEFARRSRQKKAESPGDIKPEVVMLLGPPAAGKSSISRLKADQLSKDLVKTAQSLQYREEVNNDNLTDCMPGFSDEYKHVLSIKAKQKTGKSLWKKATTGVKVGKVGDRKPNSNSAAMWQWLKISIEENLSAELWALQWLTYLVYHHGPVRDSLALDIIKVTVTDAHELPVYYSSCMAGKAMGRAMMILDLAHSETKPIAHKLLPFRGFWPYTSQEARFDRQAGRARKEQEEGKLLGGNLTSNLVDIHYHAQQAETNITKLLGCLRKGVRATDSSSSSSDEEGCCAKGERASSKEVAEGVRQKTHVKVDHFLVIDNEGKEPKVLIDFSSESGSIDVENIKRELKAAVEKAATSSRLFEKEWDAFDPYLFRVLYYFVKVCFPEGSALRQRAKGFRDSVKAALSWPRCPTEVLPMVTELDEAVFLRKYGTKSTATDTNQYRDNEHIADAIAKDALAKLTDAQVDEFKSCLSIMRKYTCLAIMEHLKEEGDWVADLEVRGRSMSGSLSFG